LNHAAIDGVRAAVEYIASWGGGATLRERIVDAMTHISAYEHDLARYYHDQVRAYPAFASGGRTSVRAGQRAPTVSITLQGHTASEAASALGAQGVCVWDGNFYAARAVELLGLEDRGGLLRTGISMYTSEEDIHRLLDGLGKLTGFMVK
jgi:selenocysteine lyase/cysteine desulfurase